VKKGAERTFVVVDAAMNDLIRPTLYDAHHEIWPVAEKGKGGGTVVDVVGPVCETGDYLALGRKLTGTQSNDLLAVMSAGAYGAVQAGTYNSRLLVPEVMVRGDQFAVVRPRQTYDELIGADRLAPWLEGEGKAEPRPEPRPAKAPAAAKPAAPAPAPRRTESATAGASSGRASASSRPAAPAPAAKRPASRR
jgi:Pyridoxal-dependent decarboxylase, C-terminal sheet domain